VHNETLSVVAVRVSNKDRSAVGINRCDAAPTPTGFHAGESALLWLRAPLMATARLVSASVCACVITAAGIHAVAEITFALLMTVLYVGTIARPIS
jgi:hypothetical protein